MIIPASGFMLTLGRLGQQLGVKWRRGSSANRGTPAMAKRE